MVERGEVRVGIHKVDIVARFGKKGLAPEWNLTLKRKGKFRTQYYVRDWFCRSWFLCRWLKVDEFSQVRKWLYAWEAGELGDKVVDKIRRIEEVCKERAAAQRRYIDPQTGEEYEERTIDFLHRHRADRLGGAVPLDEVMASNTPLGEALRRTQEAGERKAAAGTYADDEG